MIQFYTISNIFLILLSSYLLLRIIDFPKTTSNVIDVIALHIIIIHSVIDIIYHRNINTLFTHDFVVLIVSVIIVICIKIRKVKWNKY